MLIEFFLKLKDGGLPVSVREFLTLLEALDKRVIHGGIDDFYYLSRACLVKNESHYDRFDRVFGEMIQRVDQTLAAAQEFVTGPARQGMAIMAGVKAVIDSFQGFREASRRRAAARPAVEEEESLFIG